MIIKLLLIASMAFLALVALRGRPSPRSLAVRRGAFILVLAFGVVAIIVPSLVTKVANAVGVGRGADLLLYVLTVAFLLVSFRLYQRLTELERRYVELVRKQALAEGPVRQCEAKPPASAGVGPTWHAPLSDHSPTDSKSSQS